MSIAMALMDTRTDPQSASTSGEQPLKLNYAQMRGAMIAWVQALAGDRWTNYNESDPGVTILEQLCFALTELGLRAEQSIPAFLASTQSQRLQLQRQGLYAAQDILPGPALTFLDQRRWLLDQVPQAANVWLEVQDGEVGGLVKARVLPRLSDPGPCLCPADEAVMAEEVEEEIRSAASRFRNLGEDLGAVEVLSPQPLSLTARLTIHSQRHPDEILADVLYRLGVDLAPEPRRQSLEARLASGLSTADLYDGPPMLRGFIPDEELDAALRPPAHDALKEIIASVPGVLEVEEFAFSFDDNSPSLQANHFPQLRIDLNAQPTPLQLVRDAHVVTCNPERVQRLLTRFWQEHRQTFNLDQSFLQAFPLPQASTVEDGDYVSIQTLFPAVYGLSATGVDPAMTPRQQAQVRQLKGYLMLFDQAMADFAAQLGFVRDLLSPLAGGDQTYAWRSLRQVPGCSEDVLVHDYDARQAALRQRLDPCAQRQAAILDFFLTMYGQSLLPLTSDHDPGPARQAVTPQLLKAKRELLKDVVAMSRERGVGVDYRDPDGVLAPTALERRCALELRVRRPGGSSGAVVVEADPAKATFGRLMTAEATRKVRDSFLTLDGLMAPLALPDGADDLDDPLAGKTVAAVLWRAMAKPRCYRIGGCDVGEDVDLVCLDDSGGGWWLGSFAHARLAHARAHQLLSRAGAQTDAVFLIEWLLLRQATQHPSGKGLPPETFHFQVSVVMMREATPSGEREGSGRDLDGDALHEAERERMVRLLRPQLPAHLEMRVHALAPRRFNRFVALREAWLRSLTEEDSVRQASAAYRLAAFLLEGTPPVPDSPSPPPALSPPSPPSPPGPPSPPVLPSPWDLPAPAAPPRPASLRPASLRLDPGGRPTAGSPAPPRPKPPPLPLLPPAAVSTDLALKMIAAPATAEAEGVWCANPVEPAALRLWRSVDLRFLLRPLPWDPALPGALSGEELSTLLRLGFALMPYQDSSLPLPPSPLPPPELGQRHGLAAVLAAQRLGLCAGTVIWLAGVPRQTAADPGARGLYLSQWAQAVQGAGYTTGLLLSSATPLTNLTCDWLGQGDPAVPPPMLGFSLRRDPTAPKAQLLAGQGELVRLAADRRGRTPPWLTLDPRALPPVQP
ncbi:MAG: hypothetical protein VKP63_08980 [Cyanobacteriota bacterium]|nr:hypothetical protein [Cyanobacteriota bacterium]